jgi:hypothetical protein
MQGVTVADSDAPTVAEYDLLEAEAYYECSIIKCVHQRRLDTGDVKEDFSFDETGAGDSVMTIHKGRSSVMI